MNNSDREAIMNIYNEAIINTTAVYDYLPCTGVQMVHWFQEKEMNNRPVLVAEIDGRTIGFATYGTFRVKKAYQFSVEHSVYVHTDFRGRGYGRELLIKLMELAKDDGVHAMFGCIDADNKKSLELHYSLGFEQVGHLKESGFKFDRWLDLAIVEFIFK